MTSKGQKEPRQNVTKAAAMAIFLSIDLGLNSILDYDLFNNQNISDEQHVLRSLAGIQIVVEITVFLVLFLAMADTFLFRVGLLNLLLKKFRSVLMVHPIYLCLTIALGLYRVDRFAHGSSLDTIWKNQTFVALSTVQKIVAIPYYIMNLRAVLKLRDPVYFNRDSWIALIKKRKYAEKELIGSRRPGM